MKIREVKKRNAEIPDELKHKRTQIQVIDNTLYLNKIPQKKHVTPPTVKEMFSVDPPTKRKMEELHFFHSVAVMDKGSTFRGHAIRVKGTQEMKMAYN